MYQSVTRLHVARPRPMLGVVTWWAKAKMRREELHLSGVELGRMLGVENTRISDWEAGRYPNPSIKTMLKISRALNIGLDELFENHVPSRNYPVTSGTEDVSSDVQTPSERGAHDGGVTASSSERPPDRLSDSGSSTPETLLAVQCHKLAASLAAIGDVLLSTHFGTHPPSRADHGQAPSQTAPRHPRKRRTTRRSA